MNTSIQCPNCGGTISDNGFCDYCGQQMNTSIFEKSHIEQFLPDGVNIGRSLGFGKYIIVDTKHYDYNEGVASRQGIILPCRYRIIPDKDLYDGRCCSLKEYNRGRTQNGLFNLMNDRLLMPCELWDIQSFVEDRYQTCRIDFVNYGILDLKTFDYVLPCIYGKIDIINDWLAEIKLCGSYNSDAKCGVWDVRKLDFAFPLSNQYFPFVWKSSNRYIRVARIDGSTKSDGVWDIQKQSFVIPCKYSCIDEIDEHNNIVKARNFGFFGTKEITIQL